MIRRKNKFKKFQKFRKQKKIYEDKTFWIFIFLFLLLFSFFYLFCFYDLFQVKEIKITGNEKIKTINLFRTVDDLSNNKIFSYPTKSIFLVNVPSIVNEIYERFPQIDNIEFKREFPSILSLKVEERIPLIVFSDENKDFLVDKKGIAFEEIDQVNSFRVKKQEENYSIALSSQVIDPDLLVKIISIAEIIQQDLQINLKEFLIVSQERINIVTSEGWSIYIDPKRDLEWQLTKLKTDLTQEIPAESRGSLEYIDVRFSNFAPYKYKD